MNIFILFDFIIILIIILGCLSYMYKPKKKIEGAAFRLDTLMIPDNPVAINESDARRYIRIVGIEKHLKMDKYGNVEKMTYKKPKPESGEKSCHRVTCPYWYKEVACWQCS